MVHAPDLLAGVTGDRLAQAYLRAAAETPLPGRPVARHRGHGDRVRGRGRAGRPAAGTRRTISFAEAHRPPTTRIEVIVRFLALLELCKLGRWRSARAAPSATSRSSGSPRSGTLVGVGISMVDDMTGSTELSRAVEAVLLVAVEPVSPRLLAELLEVPARAGGGGLRAAGRRLHRRAPGLRAGPGGRRVPLPDPPRPRPIRRALRQPRGAPHRLSTAALETLAIVAYRQPVSRAQIRPSGGSTSTGVVRLLEQRGYIERGRPGRRPGPARPLRHHATSSWSASGWTGSTSCRRSRTSSRAPASRCRARAGGRPRARAR